MTRVFILGYSLLLCLQGTGVWARDMQGRFGLGYNSEFASSRLSTGVPGISLKYGMTRDIAMNLVLGMRSGSPTNSVAALKFFKNIFYENNLNFYFAIGAGLVGGNNKSGFDLLSVFGAEFFIPGIESLGLAFETGASFNNLEGASVLRTIGLSFLDAGIHFYF